MQQINFDKSNTSAQGGGGAGQGEPTDGGKWNTLQPHFLF